ncbi:MAG: T9SS type A sorting domain-containing protein [Bacteroidales bacterium]|nr:T9SS type A sorting domain-containing protein [Bacteroidales bacterium]
MRQHCIRTLLILVGLTLAPAAGAQGYGVIGTFATTGTTVAAGGARSVAYTVGQVGFQSHGSDTLIEEGIQHLHSHFRHATQKDSNSIEIYQIDSHTLGIIDSQRYARYRWYRDGVVVAEGAHQPTYQQKNDALLYGCYYLEACIDASNCQWERSNTLCIELNKIASAEDGTQLLATPNPVRRGERLTITASNISAHGASLSIYDARGLCHLERPVNQPTQHLTVDLPAGLYIVVMVMRDGTIERRRVVVQ